jgi:hypothetical protein
VPASTTIATPRKKVIPVKCFDVVCVELCFIVFTMSSSYSIPNTLVLCV